MGDVLSQKEIDLLLNGLADGQIDTEKIETVDSCRVRVYDFKRPNKFSKQHLNSLRNIHDNYCGSIKNYLTAHLHSVISAKIASIEQITYDEFIRSLPNPTALGIFSLKPLEGMMLFEVGSAVTFTIIDRLLGGEGSGYQENRDLTDIEKTIIERRVRQMVEMFKESWADVFPVTPQLIQLETNPQFVQILPPNEIIALVTLEVLIGEVSGMINICLPHIVLGPVLEKLNTLSAFAAHPVATSPQLSLKALQSKLEGIPLELVVMLGQTEILVRDLLDLAPGDVIPLAQGIKSKLPLFLGQSVKFFGIPGLHGEQLAVQITEIVSQGGDDNG